MSGIYVNEQYLKSMFENFTSQLYLGSGSILGVGVPVGTILPWMSGYFGDGSNGSFTRVLGSDNTVAAANTLLNGSGFYVCDGAALNDSASPIFNGASRYLPNLTDDRFIMGGTTVGGIGGSSSIAHTHSVTSNVTVGNHTALSATYPNHRHHVMDMNGSYELEGYSVTGTVVDINYYSTFAPAAGAVGYSRNRAETNAYYTVSDGGGSVTFSQNITAHSVTNNAVTSGAASVTENRPKYLSCFYIMKVK